MFLYKIQVLPLGSILGHGRYKDELIQALSGWDISEGVTSTLEKRFDQSTRLGVCHLIPIGLFHDDQVLWQGLKARVGQ